MFSHLLAIGFLYLAADHLQRMVFFYSGPDWLDPAVLVQYTIYAVGFLLIMGLLARFSLRPSFIIFSRGTELCAILVVALGFYTGYLYYSAETSILYQTNHLRVVHTDLFYYHCSLAIENVDSYFKSTTPIVEACAFELFDISKHYHLTSSQLTHLLQERAISVSQTEFFNLISLLGCNYALYELLVSYFFG